MQGIRCDGRRSLGSLGRPLALRGHHHAWLRLLRHHGPLHWHGLLWALWRLLLLLGLSCLLHARLHSWLHSRLWPLAWRHALHDLLPARSHHRHWGLHGNWHTLLRLLVVYGQAVHHAIVLLGLRHHLDLPCHLDCAGRWVLLWLLWRLRLLWLLMLLRLGLRERRWLLVQR